MSDIAVRVEHLSKMYRLGVINNGTLRKDIQTWFALKRGKEDPNSKIGKDKYTGDKDHFWALKDVSFDIKKGDRVGIIGKNGAGKSTLLKILSRITAPTEGSIKIRGKIASLLEVGTGFHVELTGRENIFLNGAILGMKKRQVAKKMDSIIDFCGIEHHIDTPVKRYSSGMYVRLAFAVAAHLDSDILIADEVLAVGDADFQKKALGKMQDLSTGEGRTVFFVSHNMGSVEKLCNTGIILDKGRILYKSDEIRSATKKYLFHSDEADNNHAEWTNSGQITDNQWFKPLAFYLTEDDGSQSKGIHSNDHDLWVNIKGIINEKNPDLCIGYALYNEDNVLLYWSYQTDTPETEWPKLPEGEFLLRSKIPRRFLNAGKYRLELIATLHFRCWLFEPGVSAACSIFFAINGGLSDSPYFYYRRHGVLAPVYPWELINESKTDCANAKT